MMLTPFGENNKSLYLKKKVFILFSTLLVLAPYLCHLERQYNISLSPGISEAFVYVILL